MTPHESQLAQSLSANRKCMGEIHADFIDTLLTRDPDKPLTEWQGAQLRVICRDVFGAVPAVVVFKQTKETTHDQAIG